MKPYSSVALFVLLGCGGALWSESAMEKVVAEFRSTKGLSIPTLSAGFSAACSVRAQSLAEAGALSHVDPRGRGPGVEMLSLGFPPGEYGEIMGAGAELADVWTAWLASPAHRQVLSSEGWTRWGWGRYDLANTVVWVVRFYRP